MNFSCDQCGAQYKISDEKVGDRGIKVKCKKCEHMIIVRPLVDALAQDELAAASAPPSAGPGEGFGGDANPGGGEVAGAFDNLFGGGGADDAAGSAGAGSDFGGGGGGGGGDGAAGEKEWYVSVDDNQIGPVDVAEIGQRCASGEISGESMAWKTGMGDWAPVAEIPELSHLVASPSQASAAVAPGLGASLAAARSGPSVAGAAVSPMSFGGGDTAGEDVGWQPSAASALSSLVQDELVTAPSPAAESSDLGAPMGMPSFGGPSAGNGGSMPSFPSGGDSFSSAAPAFALPPPPTAAGGGLKFWHILLTLVTVVILAGVGLVVWKVVFAPAMVVAQAPPPPPSPAPSPPQPERVAQAPAPDPVTPPSPEPDRGSANRGGNKRPAPAKGSSGRGSSKGDKGGKGGGRDKGGAGMGDVFDDAPPARNVKANLTVQDIVAGVKKNAGKVMPCLKTARGNGEIVPGTYKLILDWQITPAGSVSGARLVGPANVMGTSLPGCFAAKMRGWQFSPSKAGAPVKNFPFGPFTVK